jgi:hypothetical protein
MTSEESDLRDAEAAFAALPEWQKDHLLRWIGPTARHSDHRVSYQQKHEFERSVGGFYVTNAAFKGAVLRGRQNDPG